MEGNQYFQNALANFTQEAANGGAIRHLADLGFTVGQIVERLDFPASYEKVRLAVWEHLGEAGVILPAEPGSCAPREKPVYVREYDRYGKVSFRRVAAQAEPAAAIVWKEQAFAAAQGAGAEGLLSLLKRELEENGREASYMSCDFGMTAEKSPLQYEEMLQALERREREYVSGLPWERKRVYHRLNAPMEAVLLQLCAAGQYRGECCFLKTEDRIRIG